MYTKFEDYRNCLEKNQIIIWQERAKSEPHNAFTEEVSKLELSFKMIKDYNNLKSSEYNIK